MNTLPINNIVIIDNGKEFHTKDVLSDKRLFEIAKSCIYFGGFITICDSINKENATVCIKINQMGYGEPKLINASPSLYDTYLKTKS